MQYNANTQMKNRAWNKGKRAWDPPQPHGFRLTKNSHRDAFSTPMPRYKPCRIEPRVAWRKGT